MDFYCFQRWKEVPIDVMVLSLSRLSDFCQHEILRGRADLGNYHLRSCIPSSPLPVHSTPPVISAPEASVDEVRNGTNAGSDGTVLTLSAATARLRPIRSLLLHLVRRMLSPTQQPMTALCMTTVRRRQCWNLHRRSWRRASIR